MINIKKTISTKEAMEVITDNELGTITRATLIHWIKEYKLGKKIGGRWRIDEDRFLKYLGVNKEYD